MYLDPKDNQQFSESTIYKFIDATNNISNNRQQNKQPKLLRAVITLPEQYVWAENVIDLMQKNA